MCHIIPVEKNKIAFCCHVGRSGINCNPKYILKEIIAQKLPYKLVWICNKEFIQYDDEFKEVEFGIGSGNLWLQCELENGSLTFCSPRKSWKSESGNKLVELINSVCPIKDIKAYKQYTGPLFFIHMFK